MAKALSNGGKTKRGSIANAAGLCFAILAAGSGAIAGTAHAETTAGTIVTNTAQLTLSTADGDRTIPSNAVALTIAERLDVTLVRSGSGSVTVPADGIAIPFVLTNAGNGQEAFSLAAVVSDASASVRLIAIDVDGDGRYDPARDTLITDGRTPVLAPGATLSLLVVIDPATSTVTAASMSLSAKAVTGSGAPGTVFASQGDGGGDAVTGATGASATAAVPLGATAAAPTLVKSQTVLAPNGSVTATRDAIVTYSLEARFPAAASGARIADPIPAGTVYVPGSLTLDGAALSDAADADAGVVDAGGVAVTLGDIAMSGTGAAIRTVRFQVKIQ